MVVPGLFFTTFRVRQWKRWNNTHESNMDRRELQFPRLECISRYGRKGERDDGVYV